MDLLQWFHNLTVTNNTKNTSFINWYDEYINNDLKLTQIVDNDADNLADADAENVVTNISKISNTDTKITILNNIEFNYDSKNNLFINKESLNKLSNQEIYNSIENILNDLESINNRGFINNTRELPVVLDILKLLNINIDDLERQDKLLETNSLLANYKWLYNLIIFNLYKLSLELINKIENDIILHNINDFNEMETDLLLDYKNLSKNLFNKLETSIRSKLQRRCISIIQNIYTAFDTEFKNIDAQTNKLLSVQFFLNTRTYLKIPKQSKFKLSTVGNLDRNIYKISKSLRKTLPSEMLEINFNKLINESRVLKYNHFDININTLVNKLKELKISYFENDDDYFIFTFNRTPMVKFIQLTDNYSFESLIHKSNEIAKPYLQNSYNQLINLLINLREINSKDEIKLIEDISLNKLIEDISMNINDNSDDDNKINENSDDSDNNIINIDNIDNIDKSKSKSKALTRSFMTSFTKERVSVTKTQNNYMIAHLTSADLSMFSDFDKFKDQLDIVNKSFITLSKPMEYANSRIIIRDTMLLAPAESRSLASIGTIYKVDKIVLPKELKDKMDLLLVQDKQLFIDYALRDAKITLIHANAMEDFNFGLNNIGVPVTIPSLTRKFILNDWKSRNYDGYQLHPEYLLSDMGKSNTPKGLNFNKDVGLKLSYYIANYKGGRNECFMYGTDSETMWYDYDLTSAYSTILAASGHPDYRKAKSLTVEDLNEMDREEILYSYIIIKVKFSFPESVKYPSIPCYIDESTTVYPLKGEAILIGAEYLLAKNQGCELEIFEIFYIPFLKLEQIDPNDKYDKYDTNPESYDIKKKIKSRFINRPFENIIKTIQAKRKEFKKGTINNYLYKLMGNSIYGALVRGMGNKQRFDLKTLNTVRVEGNELTNPIIASWLTGFIRSIIGELLHNIYLLDGKIVSVTTDGFVTDIESFENRLFDLENMFVNSKDFNNIYLFSQFRKWRNILSNNPDGLEIKHSGKGIISWTTRGQLGIDSYIKATTAFQAGKYSHKELIQIFINTLKSKDKHLEYIQSSLRSAKDIFIHGGHVTMKYKDQIYRLWFDNRRRIIIPDNLLNNIDFGNVMYDSNPLKDNKECLNLRGLSKIHKTRVYNKFSHKTTGNAYKNYTDLAIRNFIKGILSKENLYNINKKDFDDYNSIIQFIKDYKPDFKISKTSLSNLKNRKMIIKPVPRTEDTIEFVKWLKIKYPKFEDTNFWI
jgi:hypothetical protein